MQKFPKPPVELDDHKKKKPPSTGYATFDEKDDDDSHDLTKPFLPKSNQGNKNGFQIASGATEILAIRRKLEQEFKEITTKAETLFQNNKRKLVKCVTATAPKVAANTLAYIANHAARIASVKQYIADIKFEYQQALIKFPMLDKAIRQHKYMDPAYFEADTPLATWKLDTQLADIKAKYQKIFATIIDHLTYHYDNRADRSGFKAQQTPYTAEIADCQAYLMANFTVKTKSEALTLGVQHK